MEKIKTKYFPFGKFIAINLFGAIFHKVEMTPRILNHERIHTAQIKELWYVGFYILYFLEWLVRLCIDYKTAYRSISFEQEAFRNEGNIHYLSTRPDFAWWGFLTGEKK